MTELDTFPNPEDLVPKIRRNNEMRPGPPPKWLGRGWLPRGEIAVLVGEEGIGKSLLWVLIAAHVTTGRPFKPFSIPKREPADVLVIVTEDSTTEVQERLKLAGADMDRITWFSVDEDGTGSPVFGSYLDGDFTRLDEYVRNSDEKPAMVVVDAWLDTVAGNLDVRNGQQARQAMHPWSTLSARHGFMTLLLTHTNRQDTTSTRDLMGDTSVLRKKARMVLFSARPRNAEEPVIFVGPAKANNTGMVNAVRFHVQPEQVRDQTDDDPGTSAHLIRPNYTTDSIEGHLIEWKREEVQANKAPTTADSAEDDLRSFMDSRGEVLTKELEDHLKEIGHAKTAIEQAKKAAGKSIPGGQGGKWVFKLHDSSVPSFTSLPNSLSDGEGLVTPKSESHYPPPNTQETSDSSETSETEPPLIWGENPNHQRSA